MIKNLIRRFIPRKIWREFRLRKIIRCHRRIALICDKLIEDWMKMDERPHAIPLKQLESDKIIWQYWAQGFDNIPPVVKESISSVNLYKGNYKIIRLDDSNFSEYIQFQGNILSKRPLMSMAHFSDLLRVALLEAYGGVWIDATIKLSGYIPDKYLGMNYFVFQRDPNEPYTDYWENAYAYYYGWADGFRVNMLNSFIVAKKGNPVISMLSSTLQLWWQRNDQIPDYFFFQILYDVLINGPMSQYRCPVVSDCLPHCLQQSMNDPEFNLMPVAKITECQQIHKLTYKHPES